jgi:hypothetical protein
MEGAPIRQVVFARFTYHVGSTLEREEGRLDFL